MKHLYTLIFCFISFTIFGQLQVSFNSNFNSSCLPANITFTSYENSQNIVFRHWDFGDGFGDSTNNPSPIHQYDSTGCFTVTLTVSDGIDTATHIINNFICVYPIPQASFIANQISPLNIQFTDMSTGAISSWNWGFGDSYTDNVQNPTHTYSNYGTYNVTLEVVNNYGCLMLLTIPDILSVLEIEENNSNKLTLSNYLEQVTVESKTTISTISIYDINGVPIVNKTKITGNKHTFDISNTPNGIYIVSVQFIDNSIETKKIVVIK